MSLTIAALFAIKAALTAGAVAAVGVGTYVALNAWEKKKQWNNMLQENMTFRAIYASDTYNSNFTNQDIEGKIQMLKLLSDEDIITKEEMKQLTLELIK